MGVAFGVEVGVGKADGDADALASGDGVNTVSAGITGDGVGDGISFLPLPK